MGNTAGATATQAIPIGIAVGRQRLQETTTSQATGLQAKDLNRFGLGLADLGKFKYNLFILFFCFLLLFIYYISLKIAKEILMDNFTGKHICLP